MGVSFGDARLFFSFFLLLYFVEDQCSLGRRYERFEQIYVFHGAQGSLGIRQSYPIQNPRARKSLINTTKYVEK